MNPDFIYFKEVTLDDNNKFTLAFSDEEFALQINFFTNLDYYIATLNCNLILKKNIFMIKKQKNYLKKVEFYLKKDQHIKMILVG